MNDFHSEPSYDEVLRLSKDLTEVCNESTTFVQSSQSSASGSDLKPTAFQQNYLDLSVRRFFLGLHRLYAIRARKDPRYYFSRKVCMDAAVTMTYPLPDDDFYALTYSARGMFREVTGHTAAVLGLELITQLEEDGGSATTSRHRASRVSREPLHQAMRQVVDTLEKRIAVGESNVKGHLFASAIVGQVEAMEAGTSIEEGIYEAAKKSAGTCYELLKERYNLPGVDETSQQLGDVELMDPTAGIPDFPYDFTQLDDMSLSTPEDWLLTSWNEMS